MAAARALPRGRSGLPAAAVEAAHRSRLLPAVITVTAERGYPAMTVADVVAAARVSRTSFYALYADKQECFLAAASQGRRAMIGHVAAAVAAMPAGADDVALLRTGLRAYLTFLAAEPAFALAYYLELAAVGRPGWDEAAEARRRLAARTAVWHIRARARHPQWPVMPDAVFGALSAATEDMVREQLRAAGAAGLPTLSDVLVDVHVRVLTG